MDNLAGGATPAAESELTLVGRLMASRFAVRALSALPMPLWVMRAVLRRDNTCENERDSWDRLRSSEEQARYDAVRAVTEDFAADGFVLDIGCSQGILQEGLRYRRYLGVDSAPASIALAQTKANASTSFICADGATFVSDESPDAIVFNETVYYLDRPLAAIDHHARALAPGGVLVISLFARTWASRRLMRQIGRRLEVVQASLIRSGHLAWTVAAFRPRA